MHTEVGGYLAKCVRIAASIALVSESVSKICRYRAALAAKNVAGSCALNFDATDLLQFEPSYPQVFRGRSEVDLLSTVLRPGPIHYPKSGNPDSCTQK